MTLPVGAARYYHPSNARIWFSGNDHTATRLEILALTLALTLTLTSILALILTLYGASGMWHPYEPGQWHVASVYGIRMSLDSGMWHLYVASV